MLLCKVSTMGWFERFLLDGQMSNGVNWQRIKISDNMVNLDLVKVPSHRAISSLSIVSMGKLF